MDVFDRSAVRGSENLQLVSACFWVLVEQTYPHDIVADKSLEVGHGWPRSSLPTFQVLHKQPRCSEDGSILCLVCTCDVCLIVSESERVEYRAQVRDEMPDMGRIYYACYLIILPLSSLSESFIPRRWTSRPSSSRHSKRGSVNHVLLCQ